MNTLIFQFTQFLQQKCTSKYKLKCNILNILAINKLNRIRKSNKIKSLLIRSPFLFNVSQQLLKC